MRSDTTTFDFETIEPIDRYKLLIGGVVPRPIGWIGSVDADGHGNLAPYSFFNVVSGTPPTVLFSPGRRRGVLKDTLANVLATREFTVNIVDENLAPAMNVTAGEYEPQIDEADVAGLEMVPGEVVAAPMVGASPVRLECTVTQIVELADPPTNTVVFGRVLRMHVRSNLLDGTRIDPIGMRAVGRLAGPGYTRVADGYFEMVRPG